MKRNRQMKTMVYLAVLGCMTVSLAACGPSYARYLNTSSTDTSDYEQTDTRQEETMEDGGEYLNAMMAQSVVESEEEENAISLSQMLTNAIIEHTEMETIKEDDDQFVVKITYPDAGALMMDKLDQYEDAELEANMDEIYREVIEAVERGECMTETELTVEYTTDESGSQTVVMTPELANAMSGGFYRYAESE